MKHALDRLGAAYVHAMADVSLLLTVVDAIRVADAGLFEPSPVDLLGKANDTLGSFLHEDVEKAGETVSAETVRAFAAPFTRAAFVRLVGTAMTPAGAYLRPYLGG